MGARSGKGSRTRAWEFPAKSGIWISEILNRTKGEVFGASYRVTVPAKLAGSNRPSLRCQRLGRPAARDGHVDVFTGEGVGQGLAYLTESYNCIAHNVSPILC